MARDTFTLVFIIGAVVLLVLLWRRGPERRRAFFVTGLLVVGASIVLALSEDTLEQALGDAYREWRAGWAVEPSDALVASTGVGVTFRGDVAVEEADPAEHPELYPEPGSPLRWSPLYVAEGPHGGCSVIDATAYAETLDLQWLEDVLSHELDGLDQGRHDTLVARLSRPRAGVSDDGIASGYLDLPVGRAAYVDLDHADGSTQRYYIVREQQRWAVLTCHATSADDVPEDRWMTVADSLDVHQGSVTSAPSPSNPPPDTAHTAHGVTVVMPSSWRVRDTSHGDFTWMQPTFKDTTRWNPLFHARADTITCSLVDATEYADGLALTSLDDALEWELAGFTADDTTTAPRDRVARRMTRFHSDDVTGFVTDTSRGEMGVIDVTAWRGWSTRHYLIPRAGRWLYLTCDSNSPRDDLWLSIAESISLEGEAVAVSSPTPRPSLPASLQQVEAALREAAPFDDCRWRQPGTVSGSQAVVTCQAEDLGEVTYAQFRQLDDLQRWWRELEASAVPSLDQEEASSRCRDGQGAEFGYGHERVVCRQKGVRARVSWTDVDSLRAVIASSGSLPLGSLYERWEQGRVEPIEPIDPSTLFPSGWSIEAADPADDVVFYPPDGSKAWTPLLVAGVAGQECVLFDTTEYARAMSFDDIEDALDTELEAWDAEPDKRSRQHLVSWTSLMPPAAIDGEVVEPPADAQVVAGMELAFLDIGDDSLLERHYLLHDDTGWAYLSCSFDAPPDRWLSIALKLAEHPLETVLSPAFEPGVVPSPRPAARDAELHDQLPPLDCKPRPAQPGMGTTAAALCETTDDVYVEYFVFADGASMQAWYDRAVGPVASGDDAFERCEADEAVESDWSMTDDETVGGRFVCEPGSRPRNPRNWSGRQPKVVWTTDSSLVGARASSMVRDMPDLFGRWLSGDFDLLPI